MTKKRITKQDVYDAACQVVSQGISPTQALLKQQLSNGSDSSIHKYFKQWKQECFKNFCNLNKVVRIDNNILAEHRLLKLELQKQLNHNENYTQELVNAEKANILLKEENHQLHEQFQKSQSELHELKNINNFLEQTNIDIKNKLENNDNKTIKQLQQTVDDLRAELKKINETSLEALREASCKGHETLMQEKVTSINLQTKVDSLYKELMDSKKQLNDAALKYQAQTQVLLRQIDWQQKIIKEYVGDEKLRALVGEKELMLNFNNKGLAYAK